MTRTTDLLAREQRRKEFWMHEHTERIRERDAARSALKELLRVVEWPALNAEMMDQRFAAIERAQAVLREAAS